MKVLIADYAGACYGVKRALEMAYAAVSDGSSVQTLGALIHNPIVVEQLQLAGIGVASSEDDLASNKVVLRSHGVTPEVLDKLATKDIEIVDATCPHVLRAQRAAYDFSKAGYPVLVVGERDHPEVAGLKAWAERGGSQVYVVESPDDIPSTLRGPIGVVVQTTQTRELLNSILSTLKGQEISFELKDTICAATTTRQDAAAKLSEQVDCMVVIGGKNSSNTTRLFEICSEIAPVAVHIEQATDLDPRLFTNVHVVGVTAGASTPAEHIASVVECLNSW